MKKIVEFLQKNKADIIWVGIIFIIALILRIVAINNYGALTGDEPYSWSFANQNSIFEVIKRVITTDFHMPLYFVYLHIWIKLFGDSYASLHSSSLFLFMLTIPIVFCIMKKCFNKTSAYFAIIILALNTFCIYYSIYVRFYSALILLGILYTYFFIQLCKKFEKKYIIGFTITHFILLYTYNLSLILSFFCGIVGLIYVIKCKKEYLKKFINTFLIIGLVSIPAIIIIFSNTLAISKTLCSYREEFFDFKLFAIYDLLENFLTNENFRLTAQRNIYRNFFLLIKNPLYFICVGIPVFVSFFAFIKSLFSKNSKLYLLIIPSLLTLTTVFVLAHQDIIYYQTKYMCLIFPMIICAVAYGFTCFKEKIIGIAIFIFYLLFNISYTITSQSTILNFQNNDMGYITATLHSFDVKETDLFLSPFTPEVVRYFHKDSVTSIPFCFDEALLMKDRKSLEYYFGEELSKKLTRKNIIETALPYIMEDIPMPNFEKNLYEDYISKLEKGQKFVVFNAFIAWTGNCLISTKRNFNITYDNYDKKSKFLILSSKAIRDSILIAEKYLKLENVDVSHNSGTALYVFVKE